MAAAGAGTSAVRGIVYFGGAGAGQAVLVLAAYAVVGAVATLLGSGRRGTVDELEPVAVPA